MSGSIKDWPKLFRQAYDNLNPGGYIELCDPTNPAVSDDGTLAEDSDLAKWGNYMLEASEKMGAPLDSANRYKQQLIDAGFTNVVQEDYKWPINAWPKDRKWKTVGAWSGENILSGLEALSLVLFTKVLGWSVESTTVFCAGVRKDLMNKNIHAYWPA